MENKKKALKLVIAVVLALVAALVINGYVLQVYEVDGMSMEPTLQSGHRLAIWKLPYVVNTNRIPERGQIVIVTHESSPSMETSYIKRVIGLPGERIVINSGKVSIYNKTSPNGFSPDESIGYKDALSETYGTADMVIPENAVYVIGDNRVEGGSIDSRSELGVIRLDQIQGQAAIRIFPINKLGRVK